MCWSKQGGSSKSLPGLLWFGNLIIRNPQLRSSLASPNANVSCQLSNITTCSWSVQLSIIINPNLNSSGNKRVMIVSSVGSPKASPSSITPKANADRIRSANAASGLCGSPDINQACSTTRVSMEVIVTIVSRLKYSNILPGIRVVIHLLSTMDIPVLLDSQIGLEVEVLLLNGGLKSI